MATLYFTNNSATGDGSFFDVLTNSSPGDTIEPSPEVDWEGEVITIALSSALSLSSRVNRTISGGLSHRIRFDGQGISLLFSCQNCDIAFTKCDFVRGYRSMYGSAFYAVNSNPKLTFNECLFGGNETGSGSGAGTFSTNSSSYSFDLSFNNCVQYYDAQAMILGGRATNCVYNNCTLVGTTSTGDSIAYNNCLRIGLNTSRDNFLNLPEFPEDGDWTNTLWQSCDARQVPGSPYLTGSESELATDFLGNPRKENGALGAYEGSWVVYSNSATIDSNVSADYIEMGPNVTITFTDSYVMRANSITAGNNALITTSGTNKAFLAAEELDLTKAIYPNIETIDTFAHVNSASASMSALTWEAEDLTQNVIIQKLVNESWTTLGKFNDGFFEGEFNIGDTFRIFDGDAFFTAVVPVPPPVENYWLVRNWAVLENKIDSWAVAGTGGVDPETGEETPSWTVEGSGIGPNF